MNARLERKLRLLAVVTVASAIGGLAFVVADGLTSPSAIATGIAYGLLLGVTLAGISLFVLQGPMRPWLGSLSFTDLSGSSVSYPAFAEVYILER
jgi:adenylate cyclase